MAQDILKICDSDEREVTDEELFKVMRTWTYKRNVDRNNLRPDDESFVLSEVFGAVRTRVGEWRVSAVTRDYPSVSILLNKWLEDRMEGSIMDADWLCSSIMMNKGFASRRHRDSNNFGPSIIRAFGDFTGGRATLLGR